MNHQLKVGVRYQKHYTVPQHKTVPHLYPESPHFVVMPEVFATGFLVGLLEMACIEAIEPYINWPLEQSLGVHIDVSHEKATLPNGVLEIEVELVEIKGKRLFFEVMAKEKGTLVTKGTHERYLINKAEFESRLNGNQ